MRLLIVEDSPDDVEILRMEFEREGYELEWRCVDTEEGLSDALRDAEWDMIISDDSMPRFDSRQALHVLKECGRDIPFIIYSGTMNYRNATTAMREGVQDYVGKGDFARLMPSVARELKNAAARKAVKLAESHVHRLAYYDDLTGLPNRNYFAERFSATLAARPDTKAAVVFIDIDKFMRLNNSFGYAIGDGLMCKIAERLAACARGKCLLARLPGDEFAMFATDISGRPEVESLMACVTESFSLPFSHDLLEFDLSVSMGIAMYPEDGRDANTLIAAAESAMSQSKADTGSSYRYYDRNTVETASRRVTLEGGLRRAVERNELFLQYQPIADVLTGDILATEALVRWNHPEFGLISPDKFIPIADETGLIISIGEWVMREACRQTRAWQDMGFRNLGLSVNVSAVQFAQSKLLSQIRDTLKYSGLDPQCLEVEITESVLMRDAEVTASTLKALKDMGVRIAMDDFGTGYSSLSYLKRFPIDTLKIDKSFIQDITGNDEGSCIVSAITALGRSLHLSIVAEGVETAEQRQFLETQRCDRMQGYLLSKPLIVQHVGPFLASVKARGAAETAQYPINRIVCKETLTSVRS